MPATELADLRRDFTSLRLDQNSVRDTLQSTQAKLNARVEEVARARSQFYSAWQGDPETGIYSCLYRYLPDGTDVENGTVCVFFTADPNYVYFFARRIPVYVNVNGKSLLSYYGIYWGRYNRAVGPYSPYAWEWAPNDQRPHLPFGIRPIEIRFATATSLPEVPFTKNPSQRLLWPNDYGLSGSSSPPSILPVPMAPTSLDPSDLNLGLPPAPAVPLSRPSEEKQKSPAPTVSPGSSREELIAPPAPPAPAPG